MLELSVIIPTYNRPGELEDCIRSLLEQSFKPKELIVVDDGDLQGVPLRAELEERSISVRYLKKEIPGLTESRNAGIDMASGDVIIFFDDDVVMEPGFLEAIMTVFENDPEKRIGGVDGLIVNQKPMTLQRRLRQLVEIPFLVSGITEGKVLRSGFFTGISPEKKAPHGLLHVDFLSGCCFSFRKEVFQRFRFTGRYRAFGFGEDKDFSHRVSKCYGLITNKNARIHHFESTVMRPQKRTYGRKLVMGRYHFFRDCVKTRETDWIFFYHALFGYFIVRLMVFFMSREKDDARHLLGILDALGDIRKKKVL